MPAQSDLSDDYVAQLLSNDAKEIASRSSKLGYNTTFLTRPTINAPKPNIRFLKNVIRETDSHNNALRAKEAEESQARLRRLNDDQFETDHPSRHETSAKTTKRRRLERSQSRERDRGQSRRSDRAATHHRHRRHRSKSPRHRDEGRKSRREESYESRHSHRQRYRDRSRDDRYDEQRSQRRLQSSRFPNSSTEALQRHQESVNGHKVQAMGKDDKGYSSPREESPSADSDPLESIVGPAPPPQRHKIKSRGRGALNASSSSAMDDHFAQNYNPANDAHPDQDVELDDWDQALEALRDRQKWQQRGAERLRAAGFTEGEVAKWTKSSLPAAGQDKDEADVRWKGRGERREWDRGKIVTTDGVSTQVEWGRLD